MYVNSKESNVQYVYEPLRGDIFLRILLSGENKLLAKNKLFYSISQTIIFAFTDIKN